MSTITQLRKDRPPREFPRRSPENHPIRWVRTSTVRQYCDPFQGCWPSLRKPLRFTDVELHVQQGSEVLHPPFPEGWVGAQASEAVWRKRHAEKIAWFARNGFSKPLVVDVGIPSMNCHVNWFVQDGNHRLAAGIFRQLMLGEDPWLPLSVGGSVDYAKELGLW